MPEGDTDMNDPVIAVTPGDCTGIGPEILAKVLMNPRKAGDPRVVVVGDRRVMDRACEQTGASLRFQSVSSPSEALGTTRTSCRSWTSATPTPLSFRKG